LSLENQTTESVSCCLLQGGWILYDSQRVDDDGEKNVEMIKEKEKENK
jgi:hypothetical protein